MAAKARRVELATGSPRPAASLPAPVVVAYLHPGTVRAEFMRSMLALAERSRERIAEIIDLHAGPNLARWRNTVVQRFLDEFDAPWLWMVDTDMVFAADTLERLVAAADWAARPILGALCFSQNGDGEPFSTMYELTEDGGQPVFTRYAQWPEDTTFKVAATGTGCLLVHRRVFTAIAKAKPDPAAQWFREVTFGQRLMGEDLTFCMRAQSAGIPVHVHTGIQVGHVKATVLGKVI
jgi:GT2 family glycosyltransferase